MYSRLWGLVGLVVGTVCVCLGIGQYACAKGIGTTRGVEIVGVSRPCSARTSRPYRRRRQRRRTTHTTPTLYYTHYACYVLHTLRLLCLKDAVDNVDILQILQILSLLCLPKTWACILNSKL